MAEPERNYHEFPSTRWSLVARAGHATGEEKRQALGALVERYLPAMRSQLVRGRRIDPEQAEEILQRFMTEKLLEQDVICRAEQHRGKFRAFLAVTLDHFTINYLRSQAAKKKAPEMSIPVDEHLDAATHALRAEEQFDLAWARQVLSQAVDLMREECAAAGRPDIWGVFQARELGPALDEADPVPYADLVRRYGFVSPSQASNVLVTAKRMFVRALRTVVGEYALADEEIDEELVDLRRILSAGRAG